MLNILYVDDDQIEHRLLTAWCEAKNYQVTLNHAPDISSASASLKDQDIDLVLLDNRLHPLSDFRETLPMLSPFLKGQPVFVVSGSITDACFDHIDEFNVAGLIDKENLPNALTSGELASAAKL